MGFEPMTQRKYTIEELKRMRRAVAKMIPPDAFEAGETTLFSLLVEARLQTYVNNEADPAELEAAAERYWENAD